MSTVRTQSGAAMGHYEPALATTVLPRCPQCFTPHPRSRGLDTDQCDQCGTSCSVGKTTVVSASLLGWAPWTLAARLFLWLGRKLIELARSI